MPFSCSFRLLKIEIHKLIDTIDSQEQFDLVKEELEDRFGKLDENTIIYMYTKWFDKLVDLLKIRGDLLYN